MNSNKKVLYGDENGEIKTFAIFNLSDELIQLPEFSPYGNSSKVKECRELQAKADNRIKRFYDTMHSGFYQFINYGENNSCYFVINIPLSGAVGLAKSYLQDKIIYGKVDDEINVSAYKYRKNSFPNMVYTQVSSEQICDMSELYQKYELPNLKDYIFVPCDNAQEFQRSMLEGEYGKYRYVSRARAYPRQKVIK